VWTRFTWAFPAGGGNPVWIGLAECGGARPDVASVFGTQFSAVGYRITVSGLPRVVRIIAYAHSARRIFTGEGVDVTVAEHVSEPRWPSIFRIGVGQAGSFAIAGWAIDRGAAAGPGVDAVHAWAFRPTAAPVFLGAAT
jgi:hypothetical protein